jgi:hypothetical protein
MTLTPKEIRSLVSMFLQTAPEGCESVETAVLTLRASIKAICEEWVERSRTMKWAAEYVGPVLAAGLGASANVKQLKSFVSYWRVAGLATPRIFSAAEAIKMAEKFGCHEELTAERVAAVAKLTGRHIVRQPEDFAELIFLLTRHTYNTFLRDVALACAGSLSKGSGTYSEYYAERLRTIEMQNSAGCSGPRIAALLSTHSTFSLNDLRSLLNGLLPERTIISMAKHDLAKLFLHDYYTRANRLKISDPEG